MRAFKTTLTGFLVALVIGWAAPAVRGQDDGPCGCMDVVFVIDDTGSMDDAINNVKSELGDIITAVDDASGGNYRLGLVSFKDAVDVDAALEDAPAANVTAAIVALDASGGSAEPESSNTAVYDVVDPGEAIAGEFRDECIRVVILVTDARPGGAATLDVYDDPEDPDLAHDAAVLAADEGILISAVLVPSAFSAPYINTIRPIMQDYADTSGGQFVETNADGTGTGDAVINIIEFCGGSPPDVCVFQEDDPDVFTYLGLIQTFDEPDSSAAELYSYSNPIGASYNGSITPSISDTSQLFVVNTNDGAGVSLFVVHDQPDDLGDSGGGQADMTIQIADDDGAAILVRDDPGDGYTEVGGTDFTTDHLWLTCCTDGLVIGTLENGWSADITFDYLAPNTGGQLEAWQATSADSSSIGLVLDEDRTTRLQRCDGIFGIEADIKLCSNPNGYQCNSNGVVPATLIGTDEFDVSQVDEVYLCPSTTDPSGDLAGCVPAYEMFREYRAAPGDCGVAQCELECVAFDDAGACTEWAETRETVNSDDILDLEATFLNRKGDPLSVSDLVCPLGKGEASDPLILVAILADGTRGTTAPAWNAGCDLLVRPGNN